MATLDGPDKTGDNIWPASELSHAEATDVNILVDSVSKYSPSFTPFSDGIAINVSSDSNDQAKETLLAPVSNDDVDEDDNGSDVGLNHYDEEIGESNAGEWNLETAGIRNRASPNSIKSVNSFDSEDSDDSDGDPWRQLLVLEDGDLRVKVSLYEIPAFRKILYIIACVVSGGIIYLLSRWYPTRWIKIVGRRVHILDDSNIASVADDHSGNGEPSAPRSSTLPLSLTTPFDKRGNQMSGSVGRLNSRVVRLSDPNIKIWACLTNNWDETIIVPLRRQFFGGSIFNVFSVPSELIHSMRLFSNQQFVDVTANSSALPDVILYHLVWFDFRCGKYIWSPFEKCFVDTASWKDQKWLHPSNNSMTEISTSPTSSSYSSPPLSQSLFSGLSTTTYNERKLVFGDNDIIVPEKSTSQLIIDEILHPFYIFQIASIILWSLDDYYYYATCIFIISALSTIDTLIETKRNIKRLREMSKFSCDVRVFRASQWRYVPSLSLVPGDIIEISLQDFHALPCDAILLQGDCIVNESMLTGESVPVSKSPLINPLLLKDFDLHSSQVPSTLSKSFLFSGTKIIRVRGNISSEISTEESMDGSSAKALALVLRTGFQTTKGSLIRSMLFPKPHDFQFYRDSFRFIGVLAIIAGIGFCFSIYNFVQLRVSARTVILRALDLITIIIPPALPATMSVGTSFAISRLRRSEIFCISPSRVIISGKVNIMCFDKTGTLTEEGLDVLGVQCVRHSRGQFDDLRRSVDYLPSEFTSTAGDIPPMLHALAACHSLKTVNEECVGDPLDLKMFEWTGWELEEAGHLSQSHNSTKTGENGSSTQSAPISSSIVPTVVRPPGQSGALKWDALITEMANSENGGSTSGFVELGILKTFDFVSSLRRMTVVVKQLGGSSLEVFTKGAPEVMKEICNPTSMPSNYDSLLTTYAHNGYRVIAVAAKKLVGLSLLKAQKLKRHQVESDLTFLGFIIFENKLKPGTQSAIFTLCAARIRQTMCTGDNVLTAISVARECGMVSQKDVVFVPRFVEGSSAIADAKLLWESVDDQRIQLDPFSFKPLPIFDTAMSREIAPRDVIADYHLAVTGDVFGWMVENAPQDSLKRMLYKGQIFARMSPDQKQELVEKYQDLGYCVGFCGDGANDCGALKAADVGLSLSEAEASVAAPFTSKSVDIHCVLDLIREGRAALVTSFSCFKYMALYSFIQFTTVTLLYTFASNLGDFQFLYIDLYLILPLAVFMGRARAYHSIVPKRPTANLMSKKVLTSLIGQILLQIVFQLVLFFSIRRQPWYQPPSVDVDRKDVDCFENTVLFMLTSFQYIIMAIVFSVGPPYRASMFSNVLFILTTALLIMSSAVVVLAPFNWLGHLLELYDIPSDFRWLILGLCFTNFVASWTCENYLFPFVASMITRLIKVARLWNENQYRPLNDGRKKKKVWKQVAEDMKSW